MDIVYTQPLSRETLRDHLEAYSDLSRSKAERIASETFGGGSRFRVPIAPRDKWPPLDPEQLRLAAYRIRRLERAINQAYPLLGGEEMEPDGVFTSFLANDYLDYPRGTAATRRVTTWGEIVFLDPRFVVDPEGTIGEAPLPALIAPEERSALAAIAWGSLATEIGKSLLSSIASQIGSQIFAQLFPPGTPAYFDQVYKEFEKIVQGVIDENKRRELSAQVNSVQDGMITYNTIKKDPAKYDEAQRILSTVWNESRAVTNELKEFPEIGLGLFSVAGGLHLAIVQEKALTDRDYNNPNESPWAEDLIRKAEEFAPFAIETHNRIIKDRGDAITPVRFVEKSNYVPGAGPVDASYWTWSDSVAGDSYKYNKRKGCCDPDPEKTAKNDRQARWDSTVVVMTRDLAPVLPASESWKQVGANPIPTP